jgi:hypothetical protein
MLLKAVVSARADGVGGMLLIGAGVSASATNGFGGTTRSGNGSADAGPMFDAEIAGVGETSGILASTLRFSMERPQFVVHELMALKV